MRNKAIIALLLFLLLGILACESADYAATFNLDYETAPATSPPHELASSEMPMGANSTASTATALPSMSVCTGAEKGTLRVRKGAGTSEAEVGFLEEDTQVEILNEKIIENGIWVEIQEPNGWVNKYFLCKVSK